MNHLCEVFKKEHRRQDSLGREMAQVVRGGYLSMDLHNWAGTPLSTLGMPWQKRNLPRRMALFPHLDHWSDKSYEASVLQPAATLEMLVKLREEIQEMVVAARADAKQGTVYTRNDFDPWWFEDSKIRGS
jgi:hypothetical protein|tara:strand:- start:519 stop:908 length:390 start_codon:yes stop_codon:yes gene_type:complete